MVKLLNKDIVVATTETHFGEKKNLLADIKATVEKTADDVTTYQM